ncbi:pyridoxamine 5'-phosphate oxidase family protein [Roseinatronobacter bogoriensis]|uniref:Pyridoxamine 5'-phosphate oxidase n=1 Tax=Roseinatronobacter bogoriensis subsp. barguzinensis TaxID=441209 RepID=A0A2K8K9T9_9RHOB|nr:MULTISPECIES: pyridoxamine 5'-phosphate oxidase family protein [Rhodobaca]ATX64643.1 pyridoxamine 5'-phosphate oxidase [Rhodobaca barguzinensis]MBB4209524.1 pyridoxine/pyridoxamine 5'-phosphate oxidase [Rhodobaca bogoriensis DSM 18756]TDW35111.1 pyridoxamine 5'-phosphate oxidase [Rhodobaca barguzinensis]TDY66880.1 pyridoxamine 5'-phosphate oxidase [Rhodobaca bogoriensis DSM 18756]
MNPDPHPWASDLAELHAQVWTRLARGVRVRRAAARHPTLATVSPAGMPQARTVVLRAADSMSATVDIHTDINSTKVTELRANPLAALHVWDGTAHLQLRLEVRATILTGMDVAEIWALVPETSRIAYGSNPAPGQPVTDGLAYVKHPDPACFAVLRLHVQAMDVLHLGRDHRRARFVRGDNWAGQWLAP